MSRAICKPGYTSRRYRRMLLLVCRKLKSLKYYRALNFQKLVAIGSKLTMRAVSPQLLTLRVLGHVRKRSWAVKPRRFDCIYRLTRLLIIYQNMNYGLRSLKNEERRKRLLKYYTVNKHQLFFKYGSFLRTRSYSGFRIHKDRKKLEKMKKDIEKAERQALHRRRENSRLMRKAIMETRAARRRKLGAKVVKKKK